MTPQEIREEMKKEWDIVRSRAIFDDYVSCQKSLNEIKRLFKGFKTKIHKKESSPPPVPHGGSVGTREGSLTKEEHLKKIREEMRKYREMWET